MLRRVALVTGAAGARGIGCSIALRLAKDGLNVAVSDLSSMRHQLDDVVSEINSTAASGQRAVAVTGDVSIEGDVEAMVASVAEQLGGLDVVRSIQLQSRHWHVLRCTSRRWSRMPASIVMGG